MLRIFTQEFALPFPDGQKSADALGILPSDLWRDRPAGCWRLHDCQFFQDLHTFWKSYELTQAIINGGAPLARVLAISIGKGEKPRTGYRFLAEIRKWFVRSMYGERWDLARRLRLAFPAAIPPAMGKAFSQLQTEEDVHCFFLTFTPLSTREKAVIRANCPAHLQDVTSEYVTEDGGTRSRPKPVPFSKRQRSPQRGRPTDL